MISYHFIIDLPSKKNNNNPRNIHDNPALKTNESNKKLNEANKIAMNGQTILTSISFGLFIFAHIYIFFCRQNKRKNCTFFGTQRAERTFNLIVGATTARDRVSPCALARAK